MIDYIERKNQIRRILQLNRDYQALLVEKLRKIEMDLDRNLQDRARIPVLFARHSKKLQEAQGIHTSKKASRMDDGMGDGQSTAAGSAAGSVFDESILSAGTAFTQNGREAPCKYRTWSKKECEQLQIGVMQENRRYFASQTDDQDEPMDVATISDQTLLESMYVDWNRVSALYVPTRTPVDCMARWTVHQHPLINQSEFTTEEIKRLDEIAKDSGERDWVRIATELGTDRTAAQCFSVHQFRKFAPQRTAWTPEEDQILREAVRVYGERNWQHVAACLEHRTGQQCLHRWTKSLNPNIRRGKWMPEEDALLRAAVKLYGHKNERNEGSTMNWWRIAKHVPGRTDVQCRERWMNVLTDSFSRAPWTNEEDAKLLELAESHGAGKWSLIASELNTNRTDNQCWRRFKTIMLAKGVSPWERDPEIKTPAGKAVAPHQRTIGRPRSNAKRLREAGTTLPVNLNLDALVAAQLNPDGLGQRELVPPNVATMRSASEMRRLWDERASNAAPFVLSPSPSLTELKSALMALYTGPVAIGHLAPSAVSKALKRRDSSSVKRKRILPAGEEVDEYASLGSQS